MNHALLPDKTQATLPATYETAKLALAECNRIDECKDWGDKAQALASYAKQADDKEMEKTAQRIRARAVRRCGQLLKEIEKGSKNRERNEDGTIKGGASPYGRGEAAQDAGLSPDQAKQSIRVANVPEKEFEDQLESEKPPTITKLAEQGTRKLSPVEEGMAKGIPVYEQLGISKKAFQAGMQIGASIGDFAKELKRYSPQDVIDGLDEKQRSSLRRNIETIDTYLDQLIAKL